jgi:hypothetical protein
VKHIAFGAAALALLTATSFVAAFAAEPYARLQPVQAGAVTGGVPCPGLSRDGRPAHYVWEQGYTRKGKWGYHWACEK